jgi:fructose-1,6-bisphosphatase I
MHKQLECVEFALSGLTKFFPYIDKGDNAFGVGEFIAVFDPLDGSKNIDASLPVGSIFGIYRKQLGSDKTFLQEGNGLVAAGYCLFS